jgi:hypothetical protein
MVGFRVMVGAASSSVVSLRHFPTCVGIHLIWTYDVPSRPS